MHILELTFTEEHPPKLKDRPPQWRNDHPLFLKSQDEIPRELFPLIEDFEIVLEKIQGTSWGYHIKFFSKGRGYIAGFPWWDHVEKDLCKEDFEIPLSYDDLEQGWALTIDADKRFVYVCESDFDHLEQGILCWFKVPKEKYIAEWQLAIAACQQTCKNT